MINPSDSSYVWLTCKRYWFFMVVTHSVTFCWTHHFCKSDIFLYHIQKILSLISESRFTNSLCNSNNNLIWYFMQMYNPLIWRDSLAVYSVEYMCLVITLDVDMCQGRLGWTSATYMDFCTEVLAKRNDS